MNKLLTVILVLLSFLGNAQDNGGLNDQSANLGIRIGGNWTPNISELVSTIIPSPFNNDTYTTTEEGANEFITAGFSFCWQFGDDLDFFSVIGELDLIKHSGGYHYSDTSGLEYDFRIDNTYSTLTLAPKFNVFNGLYLSPGLRGGLNMTPSKVTYCHNLEAIYGPCKFVEEELELYLDGKHYFGWTFGLGYESMFGKTNIGLGGEAKYFRMFNDMLEVRANSYGFESIPDNRTHSVELRIYLIVELN